jgi:hypothetical protein
MLDRERDMLEVIEAVNDPARFQAMAVHYRQALTDPGQLQRMTALGARFEALATVEASDPRVVELAQELAEQSLGQLPDEEAQDESWKPAWEAFLATLPPAQRRCMELACEQRERSMERAGPG